MYRQIRPAAIVIAAAIALVTMIPGIASAHERRDVANGKYTFVVGFINEPAIVDQPNSIDLTITTKADNQPVNGAEKTLKAQIIYGGETKDMDLSPRFNAPGRYNAYFIPTKTGTWKFHFTGNVNGDPIDELFTSGPGRFNDVAATSDLAFPVKTTDQATLGAQVASAKSTADSAKSNANTGMVVGVVGIVVGALGLVVGGLAYAQTRRTNGKAAVGSTTPRPA